MLKKLNSPKTLQLGDHLVVQRNMYSHHGLYVGENYVAEYSLEYGVRLRKLEEFIDGCALRVREHKDRKYSPQESIRRAKSRLGECNYNLLFSNCEHFVNWCIEGKEHSRQVQNLIEIIPPVAISSMVKELSAAVKDVIHNDKDLKETVNQVIKSPAVNPLIKAHEIIEDTSGINVKAQVKSQVKDLKLEAKRLKYKGKSHLQRIKNTLNDFQTTVLNELKK